MEPIINSSKTALRTHDVVEFFEREELSDRNKVLVNCGGKYFEIAKESKILLELVFQSQNITCEELYFQFISKTDMKLDFKKFSQFLQENFINKHLVFNIADYKDLTKNYGYNEQGVFIFSFTILCEQLANKITHLLTFFYRPLSFRIISLILFVFLIVFFFKSTHIDVSKVNLIVAYSAIVFISFFHELGHGAACRHHKIKHGKIGFGLYVFFFVFFIDVTNSWVLERKKRIIINIGGMYFQSIITMLLFISTFLHYSDTVLFICLLSSFNILFTLNPIFKFDGHWILVDVLGIANLRTFSINFLKSFFKRDLKTKNKLNSLSKNQRRFFYLYMSVSNLFFFSILIILIQKLPSVLKSLYHTLQLIIVKPDISFVSILTEKDTIFSLVANLLVLLMFYLILKRIIIQIKEKK